MNLESIDSINNEEVTSIEIYKNKSMRKSKKGNSKSKHVK